MTFYKYVYRSLICENLCTNVYKYVYKKSSSAYHSAAHKSIKFLKKEIEEV